MATARDLASKYNVSVDEAMSVARSCGTRLFSPDWTLKPELAQEVEEILKQKIPKQEEERRRQEEEKQKPVPIPDPLLKRKLIFVTLNAMEKPGTYKVLDELFRLRTEEGIKSQLIAVSSAIDQLKRDADSESYRTYLQNNYKVFSKISESKFLTLLDGSIAEEGLAIGNYMRKECSGSDSILILGKNMSLNICVYLRNNGNKNTKNYIVVEERNISSSGILHPVRKKGDEVFGPVGDEKEVILRNDNKVIFKGKPEVVNTPVNENKMPMKGNIPSAGDTVYVYRSKRWIPLKLGAILNKGGSEGAIFMLEDDELCAKIYFAESITERKMKKLSLLCSKYYEMRGRDNSVMQRLGWPQEVLYNEGKEPVGYIMRKFKDVRSFDMIPARKFGEFVKGSKERQVIAAVSFVELIRFLHDNNVILCDINKGNVLFDDMQRAYLVDLDSTQVTDPKPVSIDSTKGTALFHCYPANVATPQFLPPERVGEDYFTFRHTKMDDAWMMQYMVFMLLTKGSAFFPYRNSASTSDGLEDIQEGRYLYYLDYIPNIVDEKDPLYPMHCIISRLPLEIRRAFFNSFNKMGRRFNAKDRADAYTWMIWLVKYYYELPEMSKRDPEDGKFLPSSIKLAHSSKRTGKLKNDGIEDFLDRLDSWIAKS